MGEGLNARIWLKMDTLQPSGSFKIRGIGHAMMHYVNEGATEFVAASGGNAGLATAYAGRRLNKPVTVVVPTTTKPIAKELIEREGAKVVVSGDNFLASHDFAIKLCDNKKRYIHPFDDPLIWHGHASLVDEILMDGIIPDLIIVSVGGGGLLLGIDQGLKRHNLNMTSILAVETEGADSFNRSILANELIELSKITSIATSLGAKKVSKALYELKDNKNLISHVVSDKSAVNAVDRFLNDHRQLVEPACGASLAPVYEKLDKLNQFKEIVVVVCGGVGFTLEDLNEFNF
tara:strand:- start:5567 stop:6436 length:870 start_codon:yes stop_codon:yes gene_type:complete